MAGETLLLEVKDFKDPLHWRWVLTDGQGKFLQDFEVNLDSSDPNYPAFLDLQGFLDTHSTSDKWLDDQARLIHQVGAWMGKESLGRIGERLAKFNTPVTVRVVVPQEASGLLYRPWEIALVGGKPLALRNVSLVFDFSGEPLKTEPIPDRLRMLAVFSLPTDQSALSLRRERYELMKLINQLAQARGFAIEMRVLPYGTTRQSLQEALEEGEGWDLIHFSGHGDKATLILENPDGSYDPVSSEDLSTLLSLAGGRLKLVTLSACLSAAATLQETLEWLNLSKPEQTQSAQACASSGDAPMSALAVELMTKLGCAALAMRYPVGDDFAINLSTELYHLMLEKGNTLTRSLQLAMQNSLKAGYNAATPPLSLATPALFGSRAAELVLRPPRAPTGQIISATEGLPYFPPEPKRFVGRTGALGRASSALAPESDKRVVLFHGMAGGGKTACALELSYHQRRSPRFQYFVWHEAPKDESDIEGALARLAVDMEKQLLGFKMVHVVDRAEEFRTWLPNLSEILEQNAMLVVLDNVENLLTSDGKWKDIRWGWLMQALLEHEGLSRAILTSRRLPQDLAESSRLLVQPVNALSLNESLTLAREMPNLGKLLIGKSTVGLVRGRELVKRTLSLVQGHPKLIELADAQAANLAVLEKYLDGAAAAWAKSESDLDRFFQDGESARPAEEFLDVLTAWTKDVSRSLLESSRSLFLILCSLEDADRLEWIVKLVWPELWKNLGLSGSVPELDQVMKAIRSSGLADPQYMGDWVKYIIHPGVAQAGREDAEEKFRSAVDLEMASFWSAVLNQAKSGKQEMGQSVVTAGLRSAPYLLRLKMWDEASRMLELAIYRDKSPETVASVLPLLRHIAQASKGTDLELTSASTLADSLYSVGRWQEAQEMLRSLIPRFVSKGAFQSASVSSTILFNILRNTGRFEEALQLAEEMKTYTSQAGLGPWTQLADEGMRLQALNALGRYDEVMEVVEKLRVQMYSLQERGDQEEIVEPWKVLEGVLDTGRHAAFYQGKFEKALELNAAAVESMKSRGATELVLARAKHNDNNPLLKLKRYDQDLELLLECKVIFERENDIQALSQVFTSLFALEAHLGNLDQAIDFGNAALRYTYLIGYAQDISNSHRNQAISLAYVGSGNALAHSLAAVIIDYLIHSGLLGRSLRVLSKCLAMLSPIVYHPASTRSAAPWRRWLV